MAKRSKLPSCPWYFAIPFALSGLILLVLINVGAHSLTLGTTADHFVIGALFLLCAVLAVLLLRHESCPVMSILLLVLPVAVALYLRLLCLDYQSHDYQTFLAEWVTFFRENGGFSAIKLSVGDYNVPYLYFLAAISYLQIPDLYLIKLFSIFFDILLAWGALRLCRRFCKEGSPAPLLCFVLFLFLPTCTLNGAYWGQCDSLYAAFVLLALDAVLGEHPKTSVLLLAVAFSFKLQTIFLIPLWCAFWISKRVKFRHLLLFPVGYAVTILPALLLGKPLIDILSVYWEQMGEYNSRLSLNAPSVFSFLPHGVQVNEPLLAKLGIAAAFLLVFVLLALVFFKRKQATPQFLFAAAAVMSIGIPFFLPYMHERYFFLAGAVTLVWSCINPRYVPAALLTEAASLSSYCTYLRLKYTLPFQLGGQYFVMAFEAALMLAALVWSLVVFIRQFRAISAPKRLAR